MIHLLDYYLKYRENILFNVENFIFTASYKFLDPMEENSIQHPLSTHINEIIEKKPNWLVRYGIGAMLFFLLLFLIGAWLVKYPDTIVGTVSIVTPRPPIDVVAKISAPILKKFSIYENDTLSRGKPILLLESTTSYRQLQQLEQVLVRDNPRGNLEHEWVWLDSLGNLQSLYNNFALATLTLKQYHQEQPHLKRINSLKNILSGNTNGLRFSKSHLKSSKADFDSKRKEYDRYRTLYKKGVIAASEFEQIKQTLLQKEMSYANDHRSLNSEHMSIAGLKREILELEIQKNEHEQQLQLNYQKALNELKSQIKQWESEYLISSPIAGRLSFFNTVNTGDFITAGEKILTIIPLQEDRLQAIGTFPVENAGKIKKGNRVTLKLDAYPYHEYGTVMGTVVRISEVPVENAYNIVIELPNGLLTNYEKTIVFKQRLTATADIITKDQSVLQRIFYQFENLFKN
ncbi:MAG: HlyD family efflux transporter periplasmic adaptor subunit [Saonia sp.]